MRNVLIALFASLIVGSPVLAADPGAATLRATLAPTGTLRAAFLGANPVQGRVDPTTGAITGPVADLVQELAKRLGVPFQILPSPDARAVIGHLNDGSADIGFLAYEASRAEEVDFAGPYANMHNTYVVAEGSALKQSGDLDRSGITIGAVKGQTQELFLSSSMKQARVRVFDRQPPQAELETLFKSGEVTAFGVNRQRALELDKASAELRALPDSFLEVVQEFVVRKGDQPKRAALDKFAADMRASGFVKASLAKAGLEEGASVASGDAH
ncbi:MAG: transporter substrate-binding domain-containing protein [Steroidobacteraceae bacterium]